MNQLHRKLAAKMLELASDEFSSHGCNDFDLVKDGDMTREEADQFMEYVHVCLAKDDPEYERTKGHVTYDWLVMSLLAKELLSPRTI